MLIEWSDEAEKSLDKHYEIMLLVDHSDPDSVINQIFMAVEQLVYNPKMGRSLDDGLYKLTLKSPKYVIHYQVEDEMILVVNVYHHRQNRPI